MHEHAKVLIFAGSVRKDSYNKKLASFAAKAAEAAGARVTLVDLKDFPMPLYDADLEFEQGMPEQAAGFKSLLLKHDGFIITSPEYNGSITPLLKNVIDWASRATHKDEPPLNAYKGKVAAILSASPGGLGGLRALNVLRSLLNNLGVLVLPKQFALSRANEAFDEDGTLSDEKHAQNIEQVCQELVSLLNKIR
ncbi:MAG: NAD(P)H-dependent oxidoreductase [Candidatus Omnitrophica bacterium]|nr:NAD(P)H-dependent oxidoreductase [Candidatus Omnitrophota bacterium]